MKTIFFLLLLALGACAQVSSYAETATEAAKRASDIEARAITTATCGIRIGALGRMENPAKKVGALLMCGWTINQINAIGFGGVGLYPPLPVPVEPTLPQPSVPTS